MSNQVSQVDRIYASCICTARSRLVPAKLVRTVVGPGRWNNILSHEIYRKMVSEIIFTYRFQLSLAAAEGSWGLYVQCTVQQVQYWQYCLWKGLQRAHSEQTFYSRMFPCTVVPMSWALDTVGMDVGCASMPLRRAMLGCMASRLKRALDKCHRQDMSENCWIFEGSNAIFFDAQMAQFDPHIGHWHWHLGFSFKHHWYHFLVTPPALFKLL